MIDFISHYLAHHHYDKVGILADKDTIFLNCDNLVKSTDIKNIDINDDFGTVPADLFAVKKAHTIVKGHYDLLCLVEYKNIDFKQLKGDNIFLFYKKDDIDFFSTWEILRNNFKHIYFVRELREEVREISIWNHNPKDGIELSVILPVYNVAKYLDKCIETVTAWKAPYVEFLFVNDGSKDNSSDIILEASKKDPRIKLINKPNGGCASAREMGLGLARGQYIGFIDPDDFIDPTMFKKLFERALMGKYDIAYCGYNEYYENTKTIKQVPDMLYKPFTDGVITRYEMDLLMAYLRIGIWRMIFKKELLDTNNIHFYTDLKRYDDLPFKVETLCLGKTAVAVDEYLYFYRLEREGQDVSVNDERLYVHFDIFEHLDEFFKDKTAYQKWLYSVIRRDTHNWALSHIKPSLKEEYIKKVKEEENRNPASRVIKTR